MLALKLKNCERSVRRKERGARMTHMKKATEARLGEIAGKLRPLTKPHRAGRKSNFEADMSKSEGSDFSLVFCLFVKEN